MTQTVTLPLWIFVLVLLFAAVTFASHFLFPSVRWFFRKRAEKVIARVNERLQRPIEPFKLARRYDMIQRLIYDPQVSQAVVDHAKANGVPENVAFEQAQRYAREIVPSFSATAYFGIGIRLARWLSTSLYKVRLGHFDRARLAAIDPDATVIFVMNHRSNMDYVLVTYLAANAGALSYAVGEWARVWPLSSTIRAMGAYFIRRRSRGMLYRKVLARYVQMATRGGVSQAVFPEGRLSLTGKLGEPKMGLLSYIIEDFDPKQREVIFVPVALNYDRVLEDTVLIAADKSGKRRFRPPMLNAIRRTVQHLWLRLTWQFKGFGVASVGFGKPLTLSKFAADHSGEMTEALASELMARIADVLPVLAVPLLSRVMADGPGAEDDLRGRFSTLVADLQSRDIPVAPGEEGDAFNLAFAQFTARGVLKKDGDMWRVPSNRVDLITFYANSISHHFQVDSVIDRVDSALAK